MKKQVIVFLALIVTFALSTIVTIKLLYCAVSVSVAINQNYQNPNMQDWVRIWREMFDLYFPYGILSLLATLGTLVALIFVAIKDFPVFKPLIDKFNAKRAARKEQRAAVKAEQAEEAKQARIEQLQAELDELKKDE